MTAATITRRAARGTCIAVAGVLMVVPAGIGFAKMSVLDSPHNLSVSGGKGKHLVKFGENRVCAFCHTPHNANVGDPVDPYPLWGRNVPSDAIYKPYVSSTMKADPKPDRPSGSSRLCLSCHDGTIALAQFVGSRILNSITMPSDPDPTRNPNLTTDLSDDHPISFQYTEQLAALQGQLASPGTLPPQVRLDVFGKLQCTTCHDPHDNQNGNFLVINNSTSGSPLCVVCHKNTGWGAGSHNPTNTPALASGCMGCHYVHSAPMPARLLHAVKEEDNCLSACHDSTGPALANVKPLFDPAKYRHPVEQTTGVHDENESLPAQSNHVECADCHNPHQANGSNIPLSNAPFTNGPLAGVRVDTLGTIATKEYQICFKCHGGAFSAGFSGLTLAPVNRMIQETDQQKRFDTSSYSYHPVMGPRRGTGASLLTTLQATMTTIYCSNCHNNDQGVAAGGTGPNGPHGSQYPHILMARYDMPLPVPEASRTPYAPGLYDLCYRCHAESYIMGGSSGFFRSLTLPAQNEHAKHVQERKIPCFACHDPHGISTTAGTSAGNVRLINFDRDWAAGSGVLTPSYSNTGIIGSRSCTVNCHSTGTNTYTQSY